MKLDKAIFLIVLALSSIVSGGEVIHIRYSPGDQALECMRKVWKKPVLWDQEIAIDEQWKLACFATKEEFTRTLANQQISLLEDKNWVFLIPSKYLPPWSSSTLPVDKLPWTGISVTVAPHLTPAAQQFHLSEKELNDVQSMVLTEIRSIPLERPYRSDADPSNKAIGRELLDLRIDIQQLSADGPESLIAVLAPGPGRTGRMIYGEFRSRKLQLLWDSPLFVTNELGMEYVDVNQDNHKEIVLISSAPANKPDEEMVIFDANGTELTRQFGCIPNAAAYSEQGGACSIEGHSVKLSSKPGWPTSILVSEREGTTCPDVYSLELGTFRLQPSKCKTGNPKLK